MGGGTALPSRCVYWGRIKDYWPHAFLGALPRGRLCTGPGAGGDRTPRLGSPGFFLTVYQSGRWALDKPLGLDVPIGN